MSSIFSRTRTRDLAACSGPRGLPLSRRSAPPGRPAFLDELLAELREHPALGHPFLRRFAEEPLRREQLRAHAVQHHLYSSRFVTFLAAALSNTPDEDVRAVIVLDMYDEVGAPRASRERVFEGLLRAGVLTAEELAVAYVDMVTTLGPSSSFESYLVRQGYVTQRRMSAALREAAGGAPDGARPALLRRFLAALGIEREALAGAEPLPETAAFIEAYESVCRSGHWLEALGALGPGTECLAPQLHGCIHRGIVNSAWLSPEEYAFWTVQIDGDGARGDNLLQALAPYAADAEGRRRIRSGARAVLDARASWFDGLARRLFGPSRDERELARSLPPTRRSPGAPLAPARRTSQPAPPLAVPR